MIFTLFEPLVKLPETSEIFASPRPNKRPFKKDPVCVRSPLFYHKVLMIGASSPWPARFQPAGASLKLLASSCHEHPSARLCPATLPNTPPLLPNSSSLKWPGSFSRHSQDPSSAHLPQPHQPLAANPSPARPLFKTSLSEMPLNPQFKFNLPGYLSLHL